MIDFFIGIFFSYYFLATFILLAILFDYKNKVKLSTILSVISVFISAVLFNWSLTFILIFSAFYIPVGVLWSKFRWIRHCNKIVNRLSDLKESMDPDNEQHVKDLQNSVSLSKKEMDALKNIDLIASYILGWPSSFVSNLMGDFIDSIENFIRTKIIGIYKKVSLNSYLKAESIERDFIESKKSD